MNTFMSFNFLIMIAFIIGLIYLQLKLSRSESKWLGWILPGFFLVISVIAVLGSVAFTRTMGTTAEINELGELINKKEEIITVPLHEVFATSLYILLVYNIPTVIFSAICVFEHKKDKKKQQMQKMSIQDL